MSAHLSIRTPDGPAGTLSRSVDGYVFNCAPMATPNCSTVGQSNCSRQDGVIMRGLR